jgi:hypothetical protein
MKQNKAYRVVEPEDLEILLLSAGEVGAMALAGLALVVVLLITGPI